jgi:ankyrin repeat protein
MGQSWETTELHAGAYNGDLERVQRCIATADNVNLLDSQGFSPLHWCALRGLIGDEQHHVAEALIRAGADPNCLTSSGDSALVWAVDSGNILLVELLIRNGADVNLVANVTPLMAAARNGNEDLVELLVREGADVQKQLEGFTAADYADRHGHDHLIGRLKPKQQEIL